MGYYNQPAAKLPPAALTPAEAAVQNVKCAESLEVMGKLLYNAAVAPKEDKYRRIRLTNKKVNETIVEVPGALDALKALGWVEDTECEEAALVLPAGVYVSMKEVRFIEDAKDKLKRDVEAARKAQLRASNSANKLSKLVDVQA